MQEKNDDVSTSLSKTDLAGAAIADDERALLEFVHLLTEHADRTTDADVQRLREAGFSDEQIAEAVYVTALFAFFNRVADAFGLVNPKYTEMPLKGMFPNTLPSDPDQVSE